MKHLYCQNKQPDSNTADKHNTKTATYRNDIIDTCFDYILFLRQFVLTLR